MHLRGSFDKCCYFTYHLAIAKYKNPNHDQDHATSLDQNRHTEESDAYAARQAVGADGVVRTVSGNRDQYSYHATYGTSNGAIAELRGGTYDTQSNLLSLTQRLQEDLSRQLNNAITTLKNCGSSTYNANTYVESDFRSLESELKSNLTRQLQEELQRYYGTQVNRGSHSYSIQNGRYSTQANYNTQELEDLRNQLERNLMQQLRNQYSSQTRSSSSSSYYSSQNQQQSRQTLDQTPRAHQSISSYPTPDSFPVNPEVRPSIPLTDVLTQVQTTVDRNLNQALNQIEYEYITGQTVNYQDAPNFDRILDDLKEDLKRNLTSALQTTLVEHYGQQEEHNNYSYTSRHVASGSRIANYKADDLESLKQQVLNNLIQKLGNTIQQQRQSYQTNRLSYYQQRQTQESRGSSYG
ncbi:hypothetical protein QE152_g34212 [Popillia japonica]|uniref:Uncharacterized protein n=1 Tax=Popillia japonica TaxID=7064 RepID=A0AAW1IUC3_POPJA